MEEIAKKDALAKAKEWRAAGKIWHFHMLTPDCVFNESNDRHAVILENTEDEQIFVVYTDKRSLTMGKILLKLLHGSKVLDRPKRAAPPKNPELQKLLNRAKEMNRLGIPWHHHNLFPDCQFNDHVGQWNIVMEDKDKGNLLEAAYNTEPKEDIKEIERLFYAQKE
ncbi:MAG: hypothetical protein PHH01_03160 [Patescibacteria group bacterium]|nr:hypothetical protein [Patescibacteria group bacterium]